MSYDLDGAHKRFMAIETAISMTLGGLLPAIAMWFTLSPFPMPLWGSEGAALFIVKNTIGMSAVMTFVMTFAIRIRVRKGGAPSLNWTRDSHPLLRLVPRNIVARSIAFAVYAAPILASLGVCMALALHFDPVTRLPFVIFMGLHSASIAFSLTSFILMGAMTDAVRMTSPRVIS